MTQMITNEIPAGIIDGNNKTFTTAYSMYQVVNLIVDGVEYFYYTFTQGQDTLTLTDAPTLSIYIDYSSGGQYVQGVSSLSTIRTNIRTTYLKIDPNAKVWDDNTVDYYANRGYTKVQTDFKFEIPECQTSYVLTTTSATQEYAKPSDLVRITGFFYNSQPLTRTTKQDVMTNNGTTSIPNQYYVYGANIGLYPTPDASYALSVMYNKKLPKLTDTADSLMDEDMEDLVVLRSCYLMFLSVEKTQKATMCLSQYTIAKDGMLGERLYDDDSIRFTTSRATMTPRDNTLN